MMSLRAPSDAAVVAFVRAQERVPLSYSEVGATRGELPRGYQIDSRKEVVGHGNVAFSRACRALDEWKMHVGSGVRVTPREPPRTDLTIALVARTSGIYTTSACRVVYRIDEEHRAGFAYGTLLDHPVTGEERFLVERAPDGEVTFELRAFSRPNALLFKLALPIARRAQLAMGAAYVGAIRTFVAAR